MKKPKYKVGDEVVIIKDYSTFNTYRLPNRFAGATIIIKEIVSNSGEWHCQFCDIDGVHWYAVE